MPVTGGPRPVKYADQICVALKFLLSKPPADQMARRHFQKQVRRLHVDARHKSKDRHMPQKMGRPPPPAGPKAASENRGVAAGQVLFAPIPARRKAATHRRSTPHGAPPDAPYRTCDPCLNHFEGFFKTRANDFRQLTARQHLRLTVIGRQLKLLAFTVRRGQRAAIKRFNTLGYRQCDV